MFLVTKQKGLVRFYGAIYNQLFGKGVLSKEENTKGYWLHS